jgi:hypothetical protein
MFEQECRTVAKDDRKFQTCEQEIKQRDHSV